MGAHDETRIYDPSKLDSVYDKYVSDVDKIRAIFAHHCEDARFEDGNSSYSGSIGQFNGFVTRRIDRPFDSEDEARKWILKNHEKWTPALAVRFHCLDCSDKPSVKVSRAREAAKKAYQKYKDVSFDIYEKILNGKSPLITCKNCGSKINRHFGHRTSCIGYPACPVCHHTLASITSMNRLKKAEERWKSKSEDADKIEAAEAKKKGKILWMVGGWVGE